MKPPGSSPYTIRTFAPSTVVDFVQVPGSATDRTAYMTIQPLEARDLRDLEPGLRSRARYACFTFETLTISRTGGPAPDQVQVGTRWFEVHGGFDDGSFAGAPFPGSEYILADPEVE